MRRILARLLHSRGNDTDIPEIIRILESKSPALPSPNYFDSPNCGQQLLSFTPTDKQREAALCKFLPALAKSYVNLVARGTNQSSKSKYRHLQDAFFEKSGLSTFSLPSRRFDVIQHLLDPVFSNLTTSVKVKRENGQRLKFPNYVMDLDPTSDPFREIRNLLIEAGVLALIDSREARPVELSQVALQFSDKERTLEEYGPIEHDGLPTQKSAYWHIDSSTTIRTKLLVYVNDVHQEQGPFMFVPGSHLLPAIEELAARKTNDHLRLSPKEFVSLPQPLQLHALFGEHMTRADRLVSSLLSDEVSVVGDAGTAILFDLDGIHRGGFIRTGERRLLQCNFSIKH